MKYINISIPGTTSAVKHYVPIPSTGRLIGISAVVNSTQTAGTATVTVGKKGAAHTLFTANLGTTGANGAGNIAKGVLNASATDAERIQIFNMDTVPVEITAQLVVAGQINLVLKVDEFNIGGKRV